MAIGYYALNKQNNDSNNYNVAIGHSSGQEVTTGTNNVLLGGLTGSNITTGHYNIAIGTQALYTEDGHGRNVAIGHNALKVQNNKLCGLLHENQVFNIQVSTLSSCKRR